MELMDKLYFVTNWSVMNECDAPESNNIVAGIELTGNVPNTTPDSF
jgi:hypothetical protein